MVGMMRVHDRDRRQRSGARRSPFVLGCFLALNLFAATQDIAVDGFAVSLMHGSELGPANSAQVGGFKLGNLVGGGVLVALLGVLGWRLSFAIMAGFIGVRAA